MRMLDDIMIGLMIAAYVVIIGIVWGIDKVRALCGKESLLDRWTNTW